MKRHSIQVLAHQELTEADLGELRQLFDSEYLKEFGEWDPQQPYGYASHDVHIMVRIEGRIVAGQRSRYAIAAASRSATWAVESKSSRSTSHVDGRGSLPARGRSGVMANLLWTSPARRSSSCQSPRSSCGLRETSTCADGLGSR